MFEARYSRARATRPLWYDSILDARARLEDSLNPSLRRDLEEQMPRLWTRVHSKVHSNLRFVEPDPADLLPADCPYVLDDLLTDTWYPASRRGLPDDR